VTVKVKTRTLREWLRDATADLAEAGVEAPRHDAERLACYVLGMQWGQLFSRATENVDHAELADVLQRRVAGEPLAYIEGVRGFYGLELACGPGVLVPRPETETLVDVALELITDVDAPTIVDIGTGTGAIALAIATRRDDATVIATDIDDSALAYARRNADRMDLGVKLFAGDLFDALPRDLKGRIDLVVSNPPYIAEGTTWPADVIAEPPEALFAGTHGDDVLERIVEQAPDWLRSGGMLALEIGEPRQVAVLPGADVRNDLTDRPRVVWASF
jgi:release factor glutamine methyltransferase